MRFDGSLEDVSTIERVVKERTIAMERKQKNYDNLFAVDSQVSVKVYDVLLKVEPHMFPVRFFYDRRVNMASIDIKDEDVRWLCKVSVNMGKLVERLTPQRKAEWSSNNKSVKLVATIHGLKESAT